MAHADHITVHSNIDAATGNTFLSMEDPEMLIVDVDAWLISEDTGAGAVLTGTANVIPLSRVRDAIRDSNMDVGGRIRGVRSGRAHEAIVLL